MEEGRSKPPLRDQLPPRDTRDYVRSGSHNDSHYESKYANANESKYGYDVLSEHSAGARSMPVRHNMQRSYDVMQVNNSMKENSGARDARDNYQDWLNKNREADQNQSIRSRYRETSKEMYIR